MREKDSNACPSRPSSLIESSELKVFEVGHLGNGGGNKQLLSNSTSRGSSQADLLDSVSVASNETNKSPAPQLKAPLTASASKSELLEVFAARKEEKNRQQHRTISVNDIRRAFEKAEQSLATCSTSGSATTMSSGPPSRGSVHRSLGTSHSHNRMSSLDSTTSDESSIPTPHYYGSVSSLLSGPTSTTSNSNLKDHYGSITSLASSTSLISPQVNSIRSAFDKS